MKKNEAKKRKRRLLIATLAVAGVIVSGLTYAWLTSTDSVTNTFKATGNFKTTVVENFTPPTNWQPGTTTDKVVQVTNTGTVDAYTRLELVPTLTYWAKTEADNDTQNLTTNSSLTVNDSSSYVPASKDAIKAVVEKANEEAANTWVEVNNNTTLEGKLAPLNGIKVPDEVTLYVKASEGKSVTGTTDEGKVTTENGYNYEFMAYYTYTDSNNDTKYFAVTVTDPTYGASSTIGNVTHTISNAANLAYNLEPTEKKSYDYKTTDGQAAIDKMVTINFSTNNGTLDTNNWYKVEKSDSDVKTTYYYYKHVLKSGATTPALIKSVTFKSDYAEDIYDAEFNLNVINISTQAIYDAAESTFQAAASGVDDTSESLKDSTFSASDASLEKATNAEATTSSSN